jgi:drug/metabolite transporter (DMT)-like permease
MSRTRAVRLRPRQWVGAAIDVVGLLVIVRHLAGWLVH